MKISIETDIFKFETLDQLFHHYGSDKAEIFKQADAKFFIESELAEAVRIREKSGKFVICPK